MVRVSLSLALLASLPGVLAAQDLNCRPVMFCSDASCADMDPTNEEIGTYVRGAMGDTPEVYVGEGEWIPATRTERQGTVVWTGTNAQDAAVMLAVRRDGGAFIYTALDALGERRTWVMTGTCKNWQAGE